MQTEIFEVFFLTIMFYNADGRAFEIPKVFSFNNEGENFGNHQKIFYQNKFDHENHQHK